MPHGNGSCSRGRRLNILYLGSDLSTARIDTTSKSMFRGPERLLFAVNWTGLVGRGGRPRPPDGRRGDGVDFACAITVVPFSPPRARGRDCTPLPCCIRTVGLGAVRALVGRGLLDPELGARSLIEAAGNSPDLDGGAHLGAAFSFGGSLKDQTAPLHRADRSSHSIRCPCVHRVGRLLLKGNTQPLPCSARAHGARSVARDTS